MNGPLGTVVPRGDAPGTPGAVPAAPAGRRDAGLGAHGRRGRSGTMPIDEYGCLACGVQFAKFM